MRVLIISQYFWPENFRVNELVLQLQKEGYTIEVLTSTPNYPSGKVFPDFLSNPKKYENFNGIKVHRVHQFLRGNNKISLVLNYLSFAISASIYALAKLRKNDFDLILGIQLSPIFSMIPALLCKKIMNVPLNMWVLDIWPDSLIGAGFKSKFILSILNKLCVTIYSYADILFLSSNGFEKKLKEMGVRAKKLVYFPQWVEADYLRNAVLGSPEDQEIKELMLQWSDKIIFTFTGNIGDAQDFPSVLESLKNSSRSKDIAILVIGEGRYKTKLIQNIKSNKLENTIFCLGQYPSKYMPYFYHYSQFLLVSLKDTSVFSYTFPGKVQSYMSSGRPIIGMVNGETALEINKAECGFTVASGDYIGFAKTIDQCCNLDPKDRDKIGNMGKKYAYKNFRLDSLIDKMIENF